MQHMLTTFEPEFNRRNSAFYRTARQRTTRAVASMMGPSCSVASNSLKSFISDLNDAMRYGFGHDEDAPQDAAELCAKLDSQAEQRVKEAVLLSARATTADMKR